LSVSTERPTAYDAAGGSSTGIDHTLAAFLAIDYPVKTLFLAPNEVCHISFALLGLLDFRAWILERVCQNNRPSRFSTLSTVSALSGKKQAAIR